MKMRGTLFTTVIFLWGCSFSGGVDARLIAERDRLARRYDTALAHIAKNPENFHDPKLCFEYALALRKTGLVADLERSRDVWADARKGIAGQLSKTVPTSDMDAFERALGEHELFWDAIYYFYLTLYELGCEKRSRDHKTRARDGIEMYRRRFGVRFGGKRRQDLDKLTGLIVDDIGPAAPLDVSK